MLWKPLKGLRQYKFNKNFSQIRNTNHHKNVVAWH